MKKISNENPECFLHIYIIGKICILSKETMSTRHRTAIRFVVSYFHASGSNKTIDQRVSASRGKMNLLNEI